MQQLGQKCRVFGIFRGDMRGSPIDRRGFRSSGAVELFGGAGVLRGASDRFT
jgi:hypothetical protein